MTMRGSTQFSTGAVEYFQMSRITDTGLITGISSGSVPANGSVVGMRRYKGFGDYSPTIPTETRESKRGDNTTIATFKQGAEGVPSATITVAGIDLTAIAAMEGHVVNTTSISDYAMVARSTECLTLNKMLVILNMRASDLTANSDEEGWANVIFWNCTLQITADPQSGTDATGTLATVQVYMNHVDNTAWEEDLSTNFGLDNSFMLHPFATDNPITMTNYTGDGSSSQTFVVPTDYPLAENVAAANHIWEDGTKATFTTDYTITLATNTVAYTVAGDPAAASNNIGMFEFTADC